MEKLLQLGHETASPAAGQKRPALEWRAALPSLTGSLVVLRDLRIGDAAALLSAVSNDQASRFISPPPTTVEGFERFINWSHRQRADGQSVCFAITPRDGDTPIGIFQIRSLEPGFATAEWGFALAPEFWGTGVFTDGARLVIDFAFTVLGSHRLEARAAVRNARGNRALRKLGAVQEGVLGQSFLRNGEYLDQALWTIAHEHWLDTKAVWSDRIIH